jgi:hypothetical protein
MIDRIELKKIEEENFNKNLSKARKVYQKGFDPKTLYKVLYSDFDIEFREPYGLRIVNEPVCMLAPIYRQVVVPIRPVTKKAFKKIYGVPINGFVKLFIEGRVIPLLSKSHEDYSSDYDILFKEAHIPSVHRVSSFFHSIRKEIKFDDIKELRRQLARAKFDNELLDPYRKSPNPKERVLDVIEDHLKDLKIFGYEDLCNNIIQIKDPNSIFWSAAWCTYFLTDPFTRGVGGFCNYDVKQLYFARQKLKSKLTALQYLLYRFSRSMEIYIPDIHDAVKYWDKVEEKEDRELILNALKKIPEHIEKGDVEKADEIVKEISEQITEYLRK